MVKWITAVLVLGSFTTHAQDITNGQRAGLLEVSGSIYPTTSFNAKSMMNFVGGHMAYQLDDKYSFRGDAMVFTSTQSGGAIYNDYFMIEAGFLRNFSHNRFDYFVGIELGLASIQLAPSGEWLTLVAKEYPRYYQPVWDLTTGAKFHVSRYFYFYAEAKLLNNRHPEMNALQSNLAFTGGLGLQLPTKRSPKHHKERWL